jgi:hypothetical protein
VAFHIYTKTHVDSVGGAPGAESWDSDWGLDKAPERIPSILNPACKYSMLFA